ncbi:MAG: helix-turn-helix domain-containing protein [Bacillota bacterium]
MISGRLREKYGPSQQQLAKLLGWGRVTVQRYEKGSLQDIARDLLLRQLEDPQFIRRC